MPNRSRLDFVSGPRRAKRLQNAVNDGTWPSPQEVLRSQDQAIRMAEATAVLNKSS